MLGPDGLFAGAALAAVVATWFTFLPSFIFILAGGPWVEATRGWAALSTALRAVTCTVIGVMASLGWTFFQAVVFPAPQGRFDAIALALLALALWLLLRRNWGVVRTLLLSAALGVLVLNNGAI